MELTIDALDISALAVNPNEKAETVKIYRTFERLRDRLHTFMVDLRSRLADDGTVYLYAIKHDEFMSFAGSGIEFHKKAYGADKDNTWMERYTRQEVIDIFRSYGFKYEGEGDTEAEYPSWALVFKKAYLRVPVEYFSQYLPDDPRLNTVDIGPGNFPWKAAKNYIERPDRINDPKYKPENLPKVNVFFGDLERGLPNIQDKQFDFAWASHIFEHLKDPVAGAKELSRIAKRGVVIVPSSYKEAITYFEESDHKWDIFPPRPGENKPRFVRRNETWLLPLKDQEMRATFGRLYRAQEYETHEQRYIKQFFLENEQVYDIVVPWEGEFQLEVI